MRSVLVMSMSIIFCLCFVAPCGAQMGFEWMSVASYQSGFSSGRIMLDEDGVSLELNRELMSHSRDEHKYHELLVHPGILAARDAQRVLIIGGAEGATAREVLRHQKVQNVTMVDIDEDLVKMCREHLHIMHKGSFDSPKLQVLYADGAVFLKTVNPGSFDVVIVDGIDFSDSDSRAFGSNFYGNTLFDQEFYEDVYRALSVGGTLAQYMSDVNRTDMMLSAGFASVLDFGVDIWSYAGQGARFSVASKNTNQFVEEHLVRELRTTAPQLSLSFLTADRMKLALRHKARRLKGGGGGGGASNPVVSAIFGVLFCLCCCCFIAKKVMKGEKKDEDEENEQMLGEDGERFRGLRQDSDEEHEDEQEEEEEEAEEDEDDDEDEDEDEASDEEGTAGEKKKRKSKKNNCCK